MHSVSPSLPSCTVAVDSAPTYLDETGRCYSARKRICDRNCVSELAIVFTQIRIWVEIWTADDALTSNNPSKNDIWV